MLLTFYGPKPFFNYIIFPNSLASIPFSGRGPSHCDMGGEGGEHEVGVAWEAEGMCGLAMCSQRGEQMFVSYTTWDVTIMAQWTLDYSRCGMEWTPPGCVKEVQPGLAYPACCPQVVCPQDSDHGEAHRDFIAPLLWPFFARLRGLTDDWEIRDERMQFLCPLSSICDEQQFILLYFSRIPDCSSGPGPRWKHSKVWWCASSIGEQGFYRHSQTFARYIFINLIYLCKYHYL